MSIRILRDDLKEEDIEQFEKTLVVIEDKPNHLRACPWIIPPRISLVEHDDRFVYLPFYWGLQYYGKEKRKSRTECDAIKIPFQGTLREEQRPIFREAIELLNRQQSVLLAMYPGAGKCLAKGTLILLWDGRKKPVESVIPGDQLVGDDQRPRRVLELGSGKEQLYRITDRRFPDWIYYDVNASHIMTLYHRTYGCVWDLCVTDYLQLSQKERRNLYGIYQDHDSKYFSLTKRRKWCSQQTLKCESSRVVYWREGTGVRECQTIIRTIMLSGFWMERIRRITETTWRIEFVDPYQVNQNRTKRVMHVYPIFVERLSDDPESYYGFRVDQNGRFLLWNGIVTHNTITSLALSANIGLRTFIIVNKLVLIEQWAESLERAFGSHVRYQIIKSRQRLQEGCSFYIMNAMNVAKRPREEYESLKIGLVIVDECHLIMTRTMSKSLSYLCPRYLLGLSATPFRPDGYDKLLDLTFGVKKIVRKLHRNHIVYWIDSPLTIRAEQTANGKILWNSVIDQQCSDQPRNQMIVSLCQKFRDRSILILSKRCKQIEWLHETLVAQGEEVSSMISSQKSFNKNARILIATFQKVGTGFSHEKLDMLILATDAEEYFIQYLGRVFRRPDVEPLVFDIVDKHPILRRHFLTRRSIYQEVGGTICPYSVL